MFDARPPFQIDGDFGSTSGIDEMLFQSGQRYSDKPGGPEDSYRIDLLPALPELWAILAKGSMHGLRARGRFEVHLDWTGGRLSSATIRSVGGTSARLRYAGTTIPITVAPGQQIRVAAPSLDNADQKWKMRSEAAVNWFERLPSS